MELNQGTLFRVWGRVTRLTTTTPPRPPKNGDNFCGFKEENKEFLLLSTPRYSEQIMWFFWHWKHVIILIPFPRYLAGHPLNCLYVVQKNAAAKLQTKSSKWSVLHQMLACLPRPLRFQLSTFWHLPTRTKAGCYITLIGIRSCCLFCSSDMRLHCFGISIYFGRHLYHSARNPIVLRIFLPFLCFLTLLMYIPSYYNCHSSYYHHN